MEFGLTFFNWSLIQSQAVNEILECNKYSEKYGLALTETQAIELVETREQSLKSVGRVEFGGGVLDKIIIEFCDSPYISKYNYEQTLHEMIELFYYYKNETLDLIADDDLIKYMKEYFDNIAHGTFELLEQELSEKAQNLKNGNAWDNSEDNNLVGEDDAEY